MGDPQIDVDLLQDTLQLLASAPSESGSEAELADSLAGWAGQHGLVAQTQPVGPGRASTLVRLVRGPGPHLLFSGHIDTLVSPPGTTLPVGLRGDRFYGPEVNNMKAAVAAMFAAMVALRDTRIGGQVTLLAAASECDTIGLGTVTALHLGLAPDVAINGEPTGLRLLAGHAGVARLRLVVEGRPGHVSQRRTPLNAIEGLVQVLSGLDGSVLGAAEHPDLPGLPLLNVGVVRGGIAASMAAPQASAEIDVRWCPGMSLAGIVGAVQAHADRAGTACVVRVEALQPPEFLQPGPFVCDPEWPVVAQVAAAHAQVVGTGCDFGFHVPQIFYGSDAPHLTAAGIQTCVYGPGETADLNQPDESVAWADVVAAARVYALAAVRLLADG